MQRDETRALGSHPTSILSNLVPQSLRGAGACLLVAAASSFMFRDWGQHDDVTRYLLLLGQLVLLAGAGFFCALAVREKRGARTFLSLVIAVVPVHFAVLGGVVYSQLPLDATATALPAYAVWRAPDVHTALSLALGAQLALVPVTFVAMRTLVRRHAWQLTASFIAIDAALLLPVRHPDAIGLLVACLVPVLLLLQLRVHTGTPSHSTPQGRFTRAMLAAPVAVVVGRTLVHYSPTALFFGATTLCAGLAGFAYAARLGRDRPCGVVHALQALAACAMLGGWAVIGTELVSAVPAELAMPLFVLPWAVVLALASLGARAGKRWYRRIAAILAAACLCLDALLFHDLGTALLCVGGGVALAFAGLGVKQKLLLILGCITLVVGGVLTVTTTLSIEALTHWISLTVVGVTLVLAASVFDRVRHAFANRLSELRASLRQWSY